MSFAFFILISSLLLPSQWQAALKQTSSTEGRSSSIAIVIDDSKSMADKRNSAASAMQDLVKASAPQDEFFVVHFDEDAHLDQDFTANKKLVSKALRRADARGGRALNDALLSGIEHLKKSAKYKKRILILITDGPDNRSRASTAEVLEQIKKADTPIIYCIGLFSPGEEAPTRKLLAQIANGGTAFFANAPAALDEVVRRLTNELNKH